MAALIEGETEEMSVLANVSAALKEHFGWFWVGFYLDRSGELRLGPFQGSVACMHIAYDKGVCGAAFSQRKSIVVPYVELFPGHIACSSLSRSEIVVPIYGHNGHGLSRTDADGPVWHGLECLEPSVLLECKEGPFIEHEVDGILEIKK